MKKLVATLAGVALLFSAGSAWAEETNDSSDVLKASHALIFELDHFSGPIKTVLLNRFNVKAPGRAASTAGSPSMTVSRCPVPHNYGPLR